LYGLHPNAEIDFLTTTSETLFKTVLELQPRDAGAGASESGTITSREEKVLESNQLTKIFVFVSFR
jgi:dynein heavy chain